MNVGMWWKALRVIPRIDKEEWQRLDVVARWLISTRAAVLLMTFISAALAGLFALRDGQFNLGRWALLALGLVFAHATNNLLNDRSDFMRGVDKDNYFRTQYGPQPLEAGLMTRKELLVYAAVTGAIALAAGLPLVLERGPVAWGLLAAGAFFVLFYTWPLKYIGLGELTVLLVWGPLMIGGGYFVITGQWDWQVALLSLPYALGATTVIFGKHIDKLKEDQAKKIHTLPVMLGEKAARFTAVGMIVLMYALVVFAVVRGDFSPWMLVTLAGLAYAPRPVAMLLRSKPAERPADYSAEIWPLWYVAGAFYHNRGFGMFFLFVLVLQFFLG